MKILPIQKARLLAGAKKFSMANVNPTYRGQILCSDGSIKNAIIKDIVSRELGVELLVAALGKLLGLPIPNAYLVVSEQPLETNLGPMISGSRLLFASEDADSPLVMQFFNNGAAIKDRVLRRLAAMDSVHSLFSFDTWVANIDRHSGNLLISADGVWLIDHGHCFGGPHVQFSNLDPEFNYSQKITGELAKVMTEEQKQRVAKKCSSFPGDSALVDAAKLLSKGDIEFILGTDAFTRTSDFLHNRRQYVPRLGAKIVGMELLV